MIAIENTLVSGEVVDEEFVCALHQCKGACCVIGDSGAPLAWEETAILEEIFDYVKPYMTDEGIAAVKEYGHWLIDSEGDFVTPLVDGVKQCAYVCYENGIAQCAIERAHADGKIPFQKPISCHLYPVRIQHHETYDVVTYHRWNICSPACALGKKLGIPVFQFVKQALIRKYGLAWYEQLEGAATFKKSQSQKM